MEFEWDHHARSLDSVVERHPLAKTVIARPRGECHGWSSL
jgi:hypothetical protein